MKLLRNKNEFDIISSADIITELPMGNYEVKIGAFGRIYLEKVEEVELPSKIYSNDTSFIEHVLQSWKEFKQGALGVALVGLKGLGKSFTGNLIAQKAEVPTIRIVGKTSPDVFGFLNKIEQDFVLYIDEFEKNFQKSDEKDSGAATQQDMLTFLDNGGVRANKILFIATANDDYKLNEFLKNRPSRLRYYKVYEKLDDAIIQEIIDDLLVNRELGADLLRYLPYEDLNIDVLIQIIKELNIHNKPYSSFKDFFNYQRSTRRQVVISYITEEMAKNEQEPIVLKQMLDEYTEIYEGDSFARTNTNQNLRAKEDIDCEDLKESYEATLEWRDIEDKDPKTNLRIVPIKVFLKYKQDAYKYTF